jgi:hypothetical protein
MMRIICLDMETYFDSASGYTLKKMTTEAYIRDPRFEAHGAGLYYEDKTGDMVSVWCSPRELREKIAEWRREKIALLCHHAHFDGLILSHHFDYRPDYWLDTLSMGRVCFDATVSLALESLASRFGLAPKSVPYSLFDGRHWHELDGATQELVANGCLHDCELTWQCAQYMLAGGHPAVPYAFPASELPVVDLTTRMFVEPCLVGDLDLLAQAWIAEDVARQELFNEIGCEGADLRKDALFATMLERLGVEPELKTTAKGNEKYAFAKSDFFMQDLLGHEDPNVVLLAGARLKAQSSIYQTRVERLGWSARRGPLPVYLAYAAAHTRRWGGGDKTNWHNFPRSDPANPGKGAIRRAIKAPKEDS